MERVLTNPHVDCIGHPTSRLLLKRPSTALDVEWLIARAAQTGVALELNANPRRLDIGAEWSAKAAACGVPISINSDAHSTSGLALRSHGVMVARRAGLSAEQVVNCWPMDRLIEWTRSHGVDQVTA
jgi:DNA polymerase (family 10)